MSQKRVGRVWTGPAAIILQAVIAAMATGGHRGFATPRESEPKEDNASRVALEFPYQYFPSDLPNGGIEKYFPGSWTTYAYNPERNPVFEPPTGAPAAFKDGVTWAFAGAGAIPLNGPPLNGKMNTTAYGVGMPVGVSVVKGIVYVGDDNGYTYALNALNGKLIWAHYGWNMTMSNPLVVGDSVIVSTGSAYFNYANTVLYSEGKRAVRGPGLNTIYGLDRRTGRELWSFHPDGEVMPTGAVDGKFLFSGAGDGFLYKLDISDGRLVWKKDIHSFVSMSSAVMDPRSVFLGGTNPNFFYAFDKDTGDIRWKATVKDMVSTGIGDCTPAYSSGIVVQEATVRSGDKKDPVANVVLAMDARSGKVLWTHRTANGPTPPSMKTATPMIVDGVVYEGSPVAGDFMALNLKTGKPRWKLHLGSEIRAGAAVKDGVAYLPYKAGDIAAVRISDGKLLRSLHFGGAFGPSSPVIVGQTLYVSNIYGWVNAVPLSRFSR